MRSTLMFHLFHRMTAVSVNLPKAAATEAAATRVRKTTVRQRRKSIWEADSHLNHLRLPTLMQGGSAEMQMPTSCNVIQNPHEACIHAHLHVCIRTCVRPYLSGHIPEEYIHVRTQVRSYETHTNARTTYEHMCIHTHAHM